MLTLPRDIMIVIAPFRQVFNARIWDLVEIMIVGAILTPGKRTVSAVLRTMGLEKESSYQNYHRVLNRAKWSGLELSQIMLGLLVQAFVVAGVPLLIGTDETLERRQGDKIKGKSVFRDAVRSSKKYTVHSYGLRWISMMVIAPVPWSSRAWALPFLTVLAPGEKTNQANGNRHKTSIDWIMQMISAVRRWVRCGPIVLVTDGGLTAVKLGLRCQSFKQPVTYVSRFRLDGALYEPPAKQPPGKRGPKPKKGARQPSLKQRLLDPHTPWQRVEVEWYGHKKRTLDLATGTSLWYTPGFDPLPIRWVLVRDPAGKFEPTAFLCTDLEADPRHILTWFIARWGLEVTFQEARLHLGLETQRQWSDLAIARTTPLLLGLFSLITLFVQQLTDDDHPLPARSAAWYSKPEPTFSDAIAFVRFYLLSNLKFNNSLVLPRLDLFSHPLFRGLLDAICFSP